LELTIDAGLGQMLLSAAFAIACGVEARRRVRSPGAARASKPTAWLALFALLAGVNWLALGRHPTQLVKTWDVQHAVLGAKYGEELGYFRLYECLLAFDADGPARWRDLPAVSDLRAPGQKLSPADAIAASDCAARFSAERRARFEADVAFFADLPRQPDPVTWFTDNGYNQTPFFTALVKPTLDLAPLSYALLAAWAWLDVVLVIVALAAVARAFGASAGLVLAIYFFSSFSNQFGLMGGSILRFGYLAMLLIGAGAFRAGRPAAAGAALAIATLLQVFPAIYPIGLGIWGGWRWSRQGSPPAWLRPVALGFGTTLAAGLVASVAVAGPEAWPDFVRKIGLHNTQLSQYRVGLKLLFALVWPPAPGGAVDYPAAVAALARHFPLYAAAAAGLLSGALALLSRLPALTFSVVFGSVALYVLTPVHYYFATLALLFLVDVDERWDGCVTAAGSFARALLFALSAGAFWLWRQSDGALPLVNGYWLSPGIGAVLVAIGGALFVARRHQDSRAASAS